MRDTPSKALKLQYKRVLEFGLVVSLFLHVFLFQGYKKMGMKKVDRKVNIASLEMEDIPVTEQEKQAPAPARPTVPIASEDEDLPEDETIDLIDLDLEAEAPPAPPPPESDAIVFVPYDEKPEPIGGYAAIKRNLKYPEIARKAGVEGKVLVYAQIDEQGKVVRTRVMKSLGPNGCDEAAVRAIRAVKWKPAMQRDTPVKVWIMVPIEFQLSQR